MKNHIKFFVSGPLVALAVSACVSYKAIPVAEDFWGNRGAVVGIAVAAHPEPEVTVITTYTMGFARAKTLIMSSRYGQDFDEEPLVLRDQRRIWHFLRKHEIRELSFLEDAFVKKLSSVGFKTVKVNGYIDLKGIPRYTPKSNQYAQRDYRQANLAQGLDRLIILTVKRYGPYCHYTDLRNDFTEVSVLLSGEMVDLKTNRLLWRSSYSESRIRRTVSCVCDNEDSYPCILEKLNEILAEAGASLLDNFFSTAQ